MIVIFELLSSMRTTVPNIEVKGDLVQIVLSGHTGLPCLDYVLQCISNEPVLASKMRGTLAYISAYYILYIVLLLLEYTRE